VRTTRGPLWPTVVLTLSVLGLLLADLVTLATWRAGYAEPYEYWREGTLGPIAYGIVGWLIARRVPGNRLGPLMLASTVAAAVQAVAGNLAVIATHETGDGWLAVGLAGVFHAAQTVVVGLIVAVLLLVPTGRTLSRFFDWCLVVLFTSTAVAAGVELLTGTSHDQLHGGPSGAHLAPSAMIPLLSTLEKVAAGGLFAVVLLAMVGLVLRWTMSSGDERRQVTWVVLGGLAGPMLIWLMALASPWLPGWLNNGSDTWAVAGVMLPLGIGVAVLRHGLYELDSVVSRTVSYAIVTGVVVAIYAVLVTGISQLAQGADNLAVAAATLAAAASVRPLLRRVRNRVDRQFNRTRFDAERAVHDFGSTLRTVVDPDQVTTELRGVLVRTVQPAGLAIWLRSSS
jgi:hypothetical protein